MKYKISKSDLENINYIDNYKDIVVNETEIEFYSHPGKEHYKLLSYFSTLFNNSNIIDIGTHLGHSALALSYNKSNTIYSFDIVDKVRPNIKNIDRPWSWIAFNNDFETYLLFGNFS
jgi:predicted O-methyltransferase YrrM